MARRRIVKQDLKRIADRMFATRGGDVPSETVQLGPMTTRDLSKMGAAVVDEGNYVSSTQEIMRKYISLVTATDSGGNFINLNPATSARFKELRRSNPVLLRDELQDLFATENFNLDILTRSAVADMYRDYRATALHMDELISRIGFPRSYFSI